MGEKPGDPITDSAYQRGLKEGERLGREKATNELAQRALIEAKAAQAGVVQIQEDLAPIKKLVPRVDRMELAIGKLVLGFFALMILTALTFAAWVIEGGLLTLLPL